MSELIRSYPWQETSLGPIEQWPLCLKTTLANLLHSAFPMFLFWGDDLLCFYNDAYRPSLGNNGKHPAIGKKAKEVWYDTWHFIGPLISNVMASRRPVWYEDQLVPFYRNGQVEDIYWTFSYSPAFGDNADVCGVLVTCMETTANVLARKRIDDVVEQRTEELRTAHHSVIRANEYLQNIINSSKEPLQVLEPVMTDGKIIDFKFNLTNQAYASYANCTPAELRGRQVGDVFPGYFQTSSFTNLVEIWHSGIADTWEIHYNQDGLDLYNLMSAMKLGNELVVHFTDFTKLKHLQLELLQKIKELERSNQHLEEFAHAASHDLKEPIRKVQVFLSLLQKELTGVVNERAMEQLQRIENATSRMSALVDDLLQYSHVSQRPHLPEAVDLNETLQQVLDVLELDIEQRKAVIHLPTLPIVTGYKRQLLQLFQNLVSNALKYSHEDKAPVVHITATRSTEGKGYDVIEVKDNGIGFEQKDADKIFHLFTRLHSKAKYSGTGVGLSIVKKIVENHEGFITVRSTPGIGSSFTISLPIHHSSVE